jgi:hypothetical protein
MCFRKSSGFAKAEQVSSLFDLLPHFEVAIQKDTPE